MKSRLVTIIKFLIGWPLSLLAIYYIYTIVSPHANEILPQILKIHLPTLLLGMVCFIIYYVIRGYVWHEILHYYSYDFPFRETLYLWGISELKRYIPGNVWSFLGRSMLFRERGVSKNHLATSFLIEAQLFVLSGVIVSLLALSYALQVYKITLSAEDNRIILIVIAVGVACFAGNRVILGHFKVRLITLFTKVLPPFSFAANIRLLGIDTLAMLVFGIGNYFVVSAVFPLPLTMFWTLSAYFTMALLIGYLSLITPTGLGVREGIVILLLKNFVNTSLAGFLSLFSRMILIISELLFLAAAYLRHHFSSKAGR